MQVDAATGLHLCWLKYSKIFFLLQPGWQLKFATAAAAPALLFFSSFVIVSRSSAPTYRTYSTTLANSRNFADSWDQQPWLPDANVTLGIRKPGNTSADTQHT